MSNIIIDVTQLVQWPGRLTGVPRVTYELVSRFMDSNEVIFVTWHGYDFCRIDKSKILESRSESISTQPENIGNNTVGLKFKRRLARVRALRQMYNAMSGVKNRLQQPKTNPDIVEPVAGDVLLIAEGIWSDDNYISKLIEFKSSGAKLVQVVYDMLPILTPQYSGHSTAWLTNYAKNIYPKCDTILAISQNTKKDVIEWLESQKLNIPKIEVFRLGENFKKIRSVKPQLDDISIKRDGYILCVGTIEARKNHTLLYYVYKQAHNKKISLPQIVIVGRRGWRAENIYDLMKTDPDVNDKFVILENASDEELSWLYENCSFTIYPSFYEGWGLPIAESMYYGKPCLSSNTSSMPEVAGKLAVYFDPTSPEDALRNIINLMDKHHLAELGDHIKNYQTTSWDDTYKQVKSYIMELL